MVRDCRVRHALLLLLLASGVAAQQAAPRPDALELRLNGRPAAEAPLGAVLVLRGRDLHACAQAGCRHEGVRVRVGEAEALIIDASAEEVIFIVPQAGVTPGPCSIHLDVPGRSAREARLTLLSVEAWEQRHPDPWLARSDPDELDGDQLVITRFERLGGPAAPLLRVDAALGQKLADGLPLLVSIVFHSPAGTATLESRVAVSAGRSATTTFGPWSQDLPPGEYEARVLLQDESRRQRVERRTFLALGTDSELARHHSLLAAHYRRVAAELEDSASSFPGSREAAALHAHLRALASASAREADYRARFACSPSPQLGARFERLLALGWVMPFDPGALSRFRDEHRQLLGCTPGDPPLDARGTPLRRE